MKLKLSIVLGLMALITAGCSTSPILSEVYRPILTCPAPDWTNLQRPELAIHSITPSTPGGEVARAYKVTVVQLMDYSHRLELALQHYDKVSSVYAEVEAEILNTPPKELKPNGITK